VRVLGASSLSEPTPAAIWPRSALAPNATVTNASSPGKRCGPVSPPRDVGYLLARTSTEGAPQKGISYFICPMNAPGRHDSTDHRHHRRSRLQRGLPRRGPTAGGLLIGNVNDGWRLAKVTLGNERVSLSGEGVLWGRGPTGRGLGRLVRTVSHAHEHASKRRTREVLVARGDPSAAATSTRRRRQAGREPGAEASVRKALADDHGQRS